MILKETFPHLKVYINGGIVNLEDLNELLAVYGGVMLGRKIYDDPMFLNDIEKKYSSLIIIYLLKRLFPDT